MASHTCIVVETSIGLVFNTLTHTRGLVETSVCSRVNTDFTYLCFSGDPCWFSFVNLYRFGV